MNMLPRRNGIVGLSATRRLPRLGKIKLGIKAKSKNGSEYPKDVDYFVAPLEVQARYGPRPTELEVMFPVDNEDHIFPQSLKVYSKTGGLICRGDGEQAERRRMHLEIRTSAGTLLDDAKPRLIDGVPAAGDPNEWVPVACEGCPLRIKKDGKPALCSAKANLMVMLYNVNVGGVYQIDTGSVNNIINLNSSFDYARGMVGRIAMIPFKLRRVPRQIQYDGKVVTKALLQLDPDMDLKELVALRRDTKAILARSAGLTLPAPALEALPLTDAIVEDDPFDPDDEPSGEPIKAPEDPLVTEGQVKSLMIRTREKLGALDRVARLGVYSACIGRTVESSKTLTLDEWQAIMDHLTEMDDFVPEALPTSEAKAAGAGESLAPTPADVAQTDEELWGEPKEEPVADWKKLNPEQSAVRNSIVKLAATVQWVNVETKQVLAPATIRECFVVDPSAWVDPALIATRPAPKRMLALYQEEVEKERERLAAESSVTK